MRTVPALSGLILTGLLASLCIAQDKPKAEPQKAEPTKARLTDMKVQFQPADPTVKDDVVFTGDAKKVIFSPPTIATVVANHPDVKLAEAKLQVARAELEQARLIVTQKYTTAQAKLEAAKAMLEFAELQFKQTERLHKSAHMSEGDLRSAGQSLATAKAAVRIAEADLKAIEGVPHRDTVVVFDRLTPQQQLQKDALGFLLNLEPTKPSKNSESLRTVLEKKVTLDSMKPMALDELITFLLPKTGLDAFIVRYPEWASKRLSKSPPIITLPAGEQATFVWLQLIQDEFNARNTENMPEQQQGKFEFYVRDYGLLFGKTTLAPQGALRLEEFMRLPPAPAKPAAPATEGQPKDTNPTPPVKR